MNAEERDLPSLPRHIVALGTVYWAGSPVQRPQHLHRRLARRFQVLYVEKPRNLLSVFFPERIRGWTRYGDLLRSTLPIADGLEAMPALYPLPYKRTGRLFSRFGWFERLDQRFVLWRLRRLMARRGVRDYILWIEDEKWTPFLDWLDPALVVFDCMDHREAYPYSAAVKRAIRERVDELDRRADVVLTVGDQLMARFSNPNKYMLNNATDYEHFAGVAYRPDPTPERPEIGYIGSIKEWLDFDLLVETARRLPEFDFVLIGGVDPSAPADKVAALEREPNVRLTGLRPFERLPAMMERFAAAIIPYRLDEFGKVIHPCKIYEYFAGGKPVVSTSLPEMRRYERWMTLADTPDEWTAALREAVAENAPAVADERREISRRNSWAARVEDLVAFLDSEQVRRRLRR